MFGNEAVVDDVSLTLYEGQITVLLGSNGAGKTVLAHILAGNETKWNIAPSYVQRQTYTYC